MTDAASDQSVLETRDLRMAFGGLVVFENLNFSLRRGERHAIIGPNGAGKTTFVSLVTGLLRPTGGDVMFNGRVITHSSPQQRVKAGIARTFQINSLFKALNPLASLVIALAEREGRGGISLRSVARQAGLIEEASALLSKFGLADDALVTTEKLPYGKQRLLEVALALALRPQLLLLDEPAAGLSTEQGHELFRQLAILTGDTTVLFIEHDMNLVFRYADRVSVFAAGALVVQDTPERVRNHPRVREVYLGV
jgi:branched-chain amino acid transport system ATP-binding protein